MEQAVRLARAALSRIVEPGDEAAGALIDRYGPVEALDRLQAGPAGEGFRARAAGADPAADLDHACSLGTRLVCPGEPEWPTQLDDLGPARPTGLWVRGAASLRLLALRSVAVVGARACTAYGVHVAAELAADLADAAWVVVSGGAYVL
ncbi:hypothetical protein GXW83_27335 [Streptacidiphilus sp. PB12-B1b]|uniref:DNA-processing protein DprA n=1 Tax=Streptacidiphilus sp. PB12-B1b TaxID=2705012 RepID=UPI0015FD8FFA|nr:hypothetical protein GXW83_27335 [Streptacidiphilus sp. PB12-B1b]